MRNDLDGTGFFRFGWMPQLAQMARIDGKVTGKRTAKRLIGGDECFQPFIDLAIHAFAPLLYCQHHK
jgi:hypothetical protein